MWAHKHTTDDPVEQAPKARYSEPPRQAEYNWFPLSIVIYTWTDKREAMVDKGYWETAAQDHSRSIVPVRAEAKTPARDAELQEIEEDREMALIL